MNPKSNDKYSSTFTKQKLINYLKNTSLLIKKEMSNFIESSLSKDSCNLVKYALEPCSFCERSLLIRLSCEAVGGEFNSILSYAVALELIHFSTLVLDDILDKSPIRGNITTLQKKYGIEKAVIIGEILNYLAFNKISNDHQTTISQDKQLEILRILNKTLLTLYEGQLLDIKYQNEIHTDEEKYLRMIEKTTSCLIENCLIVGAIGGGGSNYQIKKISEYGKQLGIAFQIRDDLIEIIGDHQVTGKIKGGDLYQGKMRLPIIHALQKCKGAKRTFIIDTINKKIKNKYDIEKIIEILSKCGSIQYCSDIIDKYINGAIKTIKPIKIQQDSKILLIDFADLIRING